MAAWACRRFALAAHPGSGRHAILPGRQATCGELCHAAPGTFAAVLMGGRQMPGPLQIIAVSLGPGAGLQGRVLAEVDRLQGRGVLRLLDLLFVAKDEDGT